VGSNPSRDATKLTRATAFHARSVAQCCRNAISKPVSYQCREFEVMTLSDALVAYKTYSRAEGKSSKTVRWITSSIGYFADFLGPQRQDIASITGNDLRRFIIALQGKRKFSHHPYNKPQQANLSPLSWPLKSLPINLISVINPWYREALAHLDDLLPYLILNF